MARNSSRFCCLTERSRTRLGIPSPRWVRFICCLLIGVPVVGCKSKRDRNSSYHLAASESTVDALDPAVLRQNLEAILGPESNCTGQEPAASPKQIRLLTNAEYRNSIRSIFKIDIDTESLLPSEQRILGFRNIATYSMVSAEHAAAYFKVAQDVADKIVESEWPKLNLCQLESGSACAEMFIGKFGTSIWRRPITSSESQALLGLYRSGASASPRDGMKLMIRGLLSSGNFLYRSEVGRDNELSSFEIASALSYFFWGTTPDETLLQLASEDKLRNDNVLLEQAQRLIADDRARQGTRALAEAWLQFTDVLTVNKDQGQFPGFDRVRRLLADETEEFFDQLVRKKHSDFRQLLTSSSSYGDPSLAAFYQGVAEEAHASSLSKLSFPGQSRIGLLGHGSILASLAYADETSPVKRGKFVRERILCDILMPPPASLQVKVPDRNDRDTTRERFAAHSSQEPCRSCHVRIDGIGFALEEFDAIGKLRSMDHGKPVDASGEILGLDGKDLKIDGARELSLALADSERAKKCFVIHAWRLAQGRIEAQRDVCKLRQLTGQAVQQELTLAQILVRVITDAAYLDRVD